MKQNNFISSRKVIRSSLHTKFATHVNFTNSGKRFIITTAFMEMVSCHAASASAAYQVKKQTSAGQSY
jgi:hypothetical protein